MVATIALEGLGVHPGYCPLNSVCSPARPKAHAMLLAWSSFSESTELLHKHCKLMVPAAISTRAKLLDVCTRFSMSGLMRWMPTGTVWIAMSTASWSSSGIACVTVVASVSHDRLNSGSVVAYSALTASNASTKVLLNSVSSAGSRTKTASDSRGMALRNPPP